MTLSLMSPSLLALAAMTAILMATLAGPARKMVLLAANVVFLWGLLLGPVGTLSTVLFAVLGYALTLAILRSPGLGFVLGLPAYVALFVYMRNYDFLHWFVPGSLLTSTLATVGLSFMFFKVVHVLIEARSGTLGPLGLLTYLDYTLNFTTFMMGPIQRYQDFSAQLEGRETAVPLTFEGHLDALLRVAVGFGKVYLLAPWFAYYLPENADVLAMSWRGLLVNVYGFYFFLYLNFAGYCDVMIGLAALLGLRPPENFDKPFLARNISDFWLRFHRSLTAWLTTYVFSPAYKWALGTRWLGSRPLLATNLALLLTMLVSGLWHGTTVSFLLFGLAQGIYFAVFRTWDTLLLRLLGRQRLREWRAWWPVHVAGVFITFHAVAFSLIFFRLRPEAALALLARLGGGS
jgi:D-alanyl-lipoteichoic acid acyltransferase DltB (MBOAT superfamily)